MDAEYLLSDVRRVRKRLAAHVDAANVYVSPDQRWIAYETSSQSLLARANGTGKRRVADHVGAVFWSPDGKMLAFDAVLDQGSQVYVTAIRSRRIIQLSHLPSISDDPCGLHAATRSSSARR